jgi:hypothetical protein
MNLGPVNYASPATPPDYKCGSCGAHGCKLWRRYQTVLDAQDLFCADCAGKHEKHDVSDIDGDGRSVAVHGRPHDSIGWLVPAVPTVEGDTYWGYTSVPDAGVAWWKRLPTRAA